MALALGLRLVQGDLDKHGLPAFRLVTDDGVHVVGEGEVGLTLEASRFEALRLLGSRRTMDQLRSAAFTGDLDRYLPGLVHMALPAADRRARALSDRAFSSPRPPDDREGVGMFAPTGTRPWPAASPASTSRSRSGGVTRRRRLPSARVPGAEPLVEARP